MVHDEKCKYEAEWPDFVFAALVLGDHIELFWFRSL